MSDSTSSAKRGAPPLVLIILGVAIMVGGMAIYKGGPYGFETALDNMGIPFEAGKTVATIGVFLILFPVLNMFFFTPLREAIEGRAQELESTFSEAESLRTEMAEMKSGYESRLTETEASAREQIQAQIKEAQDLKKQLMADAQRQAEEYKQSAIQEIENEKKRVLTELRVEVTKLSLQATEKILGENVDSDRNRKLIDEFLQGVEVRN